VTVGVLFLREPLTLRLGLGAALVLAGVAGALTGRGRIMPQRDNSAAMR
jgi:drug/metabolite transporter (DMT)-like permease